MQNKRKTILQKEIKKIVADIKEKYKPERIILFGSMIRGKINNYSDIDLLIVKNTKRNPWDRQKVVDKLLEHNYPIDLLIYTPQEIKQRISFDDYFIKDIIENGKTLYERKS